MFVVFRIFLVFGLVLVFFPFHPFVPIPLSFLILVKGWDCGGGEGHVGVWVGEVSGHAIYEILVVFGCVRGQAMCAYVGAVGRLPILTMRVVWSFGGFEDESCLVTVVWFTLPFEVCWHAGAIHPNARGLCA